MEDYKILIYLVLSILYFLLKGRGKKKAPVTRSKPKQSQETESQRPQTFDDIFQELSQKYEGKSEQPVDIDLNPEARVGKQVEKRLMEQEISEEELEGVDETLKELYKKGERLKTLDQLVDIEATETRSKRFDEFDLEPEENALATEIREGLSDPESAKKAIIYAEILNRKY